MEIYDTALNELKNGRKQGHWMWYIFPQLAGLGYSATARYYAISELEEARQYLAHPLLGKRLRECCQTLLSLEQDDITKILDYPDNLKLCSSMTLFEYANDNPSVFAAVLQKYYGGERDAVTLQLLEK